MKRRILATFLMSFAALSSCVSADSQPTETVQAKLQPRFDLPASWIENAQPFRVIGNIYSIGSKGLAMYLIPTREGHIVIDGGMPETAPMMIENIRKLGFDPKQIRILLNTHAHFDHSGGLAALKQFSGAKLIASAEDRSALEGGFYLGSEDVSAFNTDPVKVDELIGNGESVSLGGVTLTAHLTPGHTRGCTSWKLIAQESGKSYDTLIFCSASVAANRLVDPPQYEGIVDAYRHTFEITKDWRPDVFLSNHPFVFDMKAKREKQKAGNVLAFVDANEFQTFRAKAEQDFLTNLEKQKTKAAK